MADGSSSAAPVIKPRPIERKTPLGTGFGAWAWYRASKSGSCLRRSIGTRGCTAISDSFSGARGLVATLLSAIEAGEIVGSSRRFLNLGERVWMVPDSEVHRDRIFEMPSFK